MSEFLPKGRLYWIRVIKHYSAKFGSFENSWRQVIDKTSVEVITELAIKVKDFFGCSHKSDGFTITKIKKIAPLHIAVEQENLKLCEHILDRTEEKNPKGDITLFYRGVYTPYIGYRATYAPSTNTSSYSSYERSFTNL